MRRDIFNFNHIDNERSEAEIEELKESYEYYHKLAWRYKKSFKNARFFDQVLEFSGIFLVFVGTVTGGITLNPIVFGVLNGLGLVISSFGKMNDYKRN